MVNGLRRLHQATEDKLTPIPPAKQGGSLAAFRACYWSGREQNEDMDKNEKRAILEKLNMDNFQTIAMRGLIGDLEKAGAKRMLLSWRFKGRQMHWNLTEWDRAEREVAVMIDAYEPDDDDEWDEDDFE